MSTDLRKEVLQELVAVVDRYQQETVASTDLCWLEEAWGKIIKNMKLGNVEVYVTTEDEVVLYRK